MSTTKTQLTAPQVCRLFGISNMTLFSWRQGNKHKSPLPVAKAKIKEGRATLRFNQASTLAWAKKHDVEIAVPVEQVLTEVKQGKPGPKPRQASVSM